MRLFRIPSTVSLFLVLLTACAAAPKTGSRHSMKGWEIYTWRETGSDVPCFSVLEGTNRLKSAEEVTEPRTTLRGSKALEASLASLAKGEHVRWCAAPREGDVRIAEFGMPAAETVSAIEEFCRKRGLQLR